MNTKSNILFCGDALDFLERLPPCSVTVAYLDPPLVSHPSKEWGLSRALNDPSFGEHLSRVVQQVHRLLTDSGTMFLYCSDVCDVDVRFIATQAFGITPRYEVTWNTGKCAPRFPPNPRRPRSGTSIFAAYSKAEELLLNALPKPRSHAEEAKLFPLMDERGRYRLSSLFRPSISRSDLEWRGYRPREGFAWRYNDARKLDELAAGGYIHFVEGKLPCLKRYLSDARVPEYGIHWDDIDPRVRAPERTEYPFQQPLLLLERLIQMTSQEGDRVLDPMCGSGTSVIAAQNLRRSWWAADSNLKAVAVVRRRLADRGPSEVPTSYSVLTLADVISQEPKQLAYRAVLTSVGEIQQIRHDLAQMTSHFHTLRSMIRGQASAEDSLESVIQDLYDSIDELLKLRPATIANFVPVVRDWLEGWERLDEASKAFLPQAEYLFELFASDDVADFSPFIIQYCRSLENELLAKLFRSYRTFFQERGARSETILGQEEAFLDSERGKRKPNLNTARFVSGLRKGEDAFTLGDMSFVLGLLKEQGKSLSRSELLKDFRWFILTHFGQEVLDLSFLSQIQRIKDDFRNKAAHPNILDREVANGCREQLRPCLNTFLLQSRG